MTTTGFTVAINYRLLLTMLITLFVVIFILYLHKISGSSCLLVIPFKLKDELNLLQDRPNFDMLQMFTQKTLHNFRKSVIIHRSQNLH
jgi:hypothetical protein